MQIDTDFLNNILLISSKLSKISLWNCKKHHEVFLSLIIQSAICFGTEVSLCDLSVALIR